MSKKILISTNFSKMKTGFGRNCRELATRLYRDGYTVVEFAAGGIREGSNETKALPWKVIPVIPKNDSDFAHLMGNPEALNAMVHGHLLIDKVLKEEKPDCFIAIEDVWHLSPFLTKSWWNKFPCISWTPIDSEPMLPIFHEQQSKFKNLWVKAEFAQRCLKEIGLESKVFPCLIDQKPFRPLPDAEKAAIRKGLGLEGCFIVGFVFRNQLRKLVITLMEAFSQFQKKYPESKAKLLLHCNFAEPAGWNIPLAAKELGIDMNDILTTYICRKCRQVQVIPYHGNEVNCGACRTEKSLVNTNIDLGVTESELNTIYNLMDCYCQPATSGGHELTLEEAMLAGVPCGTVNYAFGETYINGGAYSFDFDFYRERESNFKKSQPKVSSILTFLELVYNHPDHYKQKGLEQREWALDYFSPDKHYAEIKKIIDSFPDHNYDFNFYDEKDVDFPPDYGISSNLDFVLHLYSGIFGVDVEQNNQDVQKYCKELEYQPREHVVRQLKSIAFDHNQRQKPVLIKDFIKETGRKRMILVEPGGLIECFTCLSILEGLKVKYPDWDIYMSCKQEFSHVFAHVDYLVNLLPYTPAFDQAFNLEGCGDWKGFFDIAFQGYLNPSWTHNGLD